VDGSYAGEQYVGIDLHRRRTVLVRMAADGQRLGSMERFPSAPAALRIAMAEAGTAPKVVLEATYGWYWAVETLQELGAEVHLAHPLGVKGFAYRRVKNDERDAADLADLLRMGRLPEAHIAPAPTRALRELVRHRVKLSRWRASAKTSVHAVLAKRGVVVPMSDLFGVEGTMLLDQLRLEPAYAARVSSLRDLITLLSTEITGFDFLIAQVLAGQGLSQFPCKSRMTDALRYHRGSRPGKTTINVFRAIFQPCVPVPDSPPRLLEMFRSPR
jgi:transposase